MKRLTLIVLLLSFSFSFGQTERNPQENKTVYYFIRHAEKANVHSDNPNLSGEGLERVEIWKNYFKDRQLDAIFSTNYNRTMQTAKPIAELKGLQVRPYKVERLNVRELVQKPKGKHILIVGHSNTIPMQVNALLQDNLYKDMDESKYANLYMITIENGTVSHKMVEIN